MRNKTKINVILAAIIVLGVMIIGAFSKIDTLQVNRKLTSSDYQVGAISVETGKVIESKQSFISKDLFEVEGSEIKVNEDSTVSYKVFFFDEDKTFISATDSLTVDFDAENDIVEGAKYFKIQITPAPIDGEPVVCELLNRGRYVNQLTIVVAK